MAMTPAALCTALDAVTARRHAGYRELAIGILTASQRRQLAAEVDAANTELDDLADQLHTLAEQHLADCLPCRTDRDCATGDLLADHLLALEPAPVPVA
jgi:hypothetical protein